jgi:two-component system sensor histidine kinase KdpD
VSRVVDLAARRTTEAARSNAEAETLSTLAGSLLRGEQAVPALLQRVRETFAMSSVTLLRRENPAPASAGSATPTDAGAGLRGTWSCVGSIGDNPCLRPEDGDAEVAVGEGLILVLRGRALAAGDQRLLSAFAGQLAVAYEQRRLAETAQAAVPLAEADRMRTAILNALSHDLRTPIASAKIAVSSLRGHDVEWTEADRQELLANADAALDQLTTLVTDLLDLSRVEAGVLAPMATELALDDVIAHALDYAATTADVLVEVPAGLPEVLADAGLLDRVIANLVDNAVRYSPPGRPVRVAASAHGGSVELRIVDRGPGIPEVEREGVFAPFQRRNDHPAHDGAGVGLGLAIARAFTRAMRGTLSLEDTPGGGLTAVVSLPAALEPATVGASGHARADAQA